MFYFSIQVILHPVSNIHRLLTEIRNPLDPASVKTEQPTIINYVKPFRCDWNHDFAHHHPDSSATAFVREEKLIASGEGNRKGNFSVSFKTLKENSMFCVQVELVDHPYCNSHLTVGNQLLLPPGCVNHVAEPVFVPPCESGTINISNKNYIQKTIKIGTSAGVLLILVAVGIFVLYTLLKRKNRNSGSGPAINIRLKQYKKSNSYYEKLQLWYHTVKNIQMEHSFINQLKQK